MQDGLKWQQKAGWQEETVFSLDMHDMHDMHHTLGCFLSASVFLGRPPVEAERAPTAATCAEENDEAA